MSTKDEGETQRKTGLESLSHDELVAKCKNLLSIAQRAKKARDDALEENNNYKHEIEKLNSKIEEVGPSNENLKQNLLDVRQELTTLKINYEKLEKENNSCTEQLNLVENKLTKETAIREQLELDKVNLNDDLEKLTENNNQMKIICKQIAEERISLEKQLEEVKTELYNLNKENADWITYLSTEFPQQEFSSAESWINFFSKYIQRFNEVSFKKFEENLLENSEGSSFYNNEIEKLNLLIKEMNEEKDLLVNEIVELKIENKRTLENCEESSVTRDMLQTRLDEVRIETQDLIENSEKLSEENSMLKSDKNKLEEEVNNLSIEKMKTYEENEKIKTEYKEMLLENENLNNRLEISQNDIEKINVEIEILNGEKNDLIRELNDVKQSYSKLVEENVQLQRKYEEVFNNNVTLNENIYELKNLHSNDENKIKFNIDEINSNKEIIEKLRQENEILLNNINKLECNLKEISEQKNTNFENEKSKISLELNEMKKELINLIELIISQSNQYDYHNGIVEHVEDENSDLLMVIKSLKTCINRLMNERNSFRNSIEEFNVNISCINSKLLENEKIIENLKLEKQQVKDLLEEKVFENNKMIRSLESLKLELEHISDHMKTSDKDKNDDIVENEKLSNDLKLVITEKNKISNMVKDLAEVNNNLLAEKENLIKVNERIHKDNADLNNRIVEIEEKQSNELHIINSEKEKINNCLHELMNENHNLLLEKQKLLTESEHLSKNIVEINKKFTNLEENLNTYIENNNVLNNQCIELQENRSILLRSIQNIVNNHLTLVFHESKVLEVWENDEEFCDKLRHTLALIYNKTTEKDAEIKKLHLSVNEKKETIRELSEERIQILNELNLFKNILATIDEGFLNKDTPAKETENSLRKIIDNSVIFSELCDNYSNCFNVDNTEAVKCVKDRLNQLKSNKWVINHPESGNTSIKLEQDQSWEVIQEDKAKMEESQELSCIKKSTDDDTIQKKDEKVSELQEKVKELKMVGAKLKKKVTDLNKQLENERQKYESDKSKWMHLSAAAKNAQSLQQECDRITDELEETKRKLKTIRKSCDVFEESETKLKQRVNELEMELEAKDKDAVSKKIQLEISLTSLHNVQKELDEVQKEKIAQDVIVKELERELSTVREKLKTTKLSLEQAKQETRKQSVLSLEMQDYEKSVKELTTQVSVEKDRVKQLEEELDAKTAIQNSLHEQIELLEKRIASEEERANVFSVQLNQTRENLEKAEKLSADCSKQILDLTRQLEKEKSNKDLLAIQLSDLTAENQKQIENTRLQNEALLNRVAKLESDLRCSEMKRVHVEEEMTRINKEFEAYKIRAQSVLRQRGGSAAEREAKEECIRLQELHNRTKSKLDLTAGELERVKSELSLVITEKESLEKKCDNLNNILMQRNKELDRQINEHRLHKISTDTLIQCYKSQLEEKERGYQMELDTLRDQLNKLLNKYENEKNKDNDMVTSTKDSSINEMEMSRSDTNDNVNALPPRPPLIEREDGEGSEGNESSTNSVDHSRTSGLVPLEKLLSSSALSEDDRDVFSSEKFENLRTEIAASNTRVRHLTALLSESEKDSARKEEQIAVLKEEIRRLQRCIERQPHAHNTEYLKNVVFKFVTLQSGDERSRLVSVLDTILKLSPEEHRQLTAVAKGETEQSSTWGLYLPSWPSLQS